MVSGEISGLSRTGLKLHGHAGLLVIVLAEVLLFSGNQIVGRWFTPIVWTGYILFVDAIVHKLKGQSLLVNNRVEFLIIAVVSIGSWWVFELYNAPRFWQSDLELWWHYHNLEPSLFLRRVGYDWAFATISPALFETAELFEVALFSKTKPLRPIKLSNGALYMIIVVSCLGAVMPLVVVSPWFVPLVWVALIGMLDPINALSGQPSVVGDLRQGDYRRLMALLVSGGLCGVLWEFWNYWAVSKWTYTVPYLGNVKIFEMPVLGYLGFPFFAVESWAIYVLARGTILGMRSWGNANDIYPQTSRTLDPRFRDAR